MGLSREDLETRLDEAEALIHKFAGVFRFYEAQHVGKYHNVEATVEQKTATRKKAARNALLASEAENFLAIGPVEPLPDYEPDELSPNLTHAALFDTGE